MLIYAELLSNIRQVSVACSLSSPCSPSTKALVTADGTCLTIDHEGEKQSIKLPSIVAGSSTLPIPTQHTKSLSWRLPLAASSIRNLTQASADVQAPWSAQALEPEASVHCRKCEAAIVPEGTIRAWKDLPSENWAEMMEFWHCHKPHEHDTDGHPNLASRGYGANSKISAQAGVGFVDLTSFLLFETDCTNIKVLRTVLDKKGENESHVELNSFLKASTFPIECNRCGNELGVMLERTTSVTLFKWQLAVTSNPSRRQPSLAHCVSVMLMSTLARSGCSKSIILPLSPASRHRAGLGDRDLSNSLLHIWLFNSNITFSSSELSEPPVSAVKVLYQMVSQQEADELIEPMTSDIQEINLPNIAIRALTDLLHSSTGYLADRDRTFKEWKVGLIEKWIDNGG